MSAKKPKSDASSAPAKPKREPGGRKGPLNPGAVAPKPSRVARTARAISEQVSDNPFATLVGAAAVTAGIALLLPASRREAEVMGDLAGKIGEVARDAADSAVEVGRQQVAELAQAALGSVGSNMVESLIGAANGGPGATRQG